MKARNLPASRLGSRIFMGACDAVLLVLALEALLFCCVPVYDLQVDLPFLVWMAAAAGLGFGFLWNLPLRYRFPLLLLSEGVWGICLWRLWEALCLGEVALRCSVVNTMAKKVAGIGRIQPVARLPEPLWEDYATLWIVVVGALFAGLMSWLLCRARTTTPVIALTVLPLIPALCVTEAPKPLPMSALLAVWGTLILRGLVDFRDPAGGAAMTPHSLAASILVLALLMRLMPMEGYTQPPWASRFREEIINGAGRADLSRLAGELFGWTGAGSSEYVSLTGDGPGYTGRTALRVSSDVPGKHYLRGWSADVYTGRRWEPLGREAQNELDAVMADMASPPLLALGEARIARERQRLQDINGSYSRVFVPEEIKTHYMEIENVSAPGSCVYFPYGMTQIPEGAEPEDSHLGRKKGTWKTTVEFFPDSVLSARIENGFVFGGFHDEIYSYYGEWWDEWFEQAEADPYRNFVYAHALQVPEGLQEELAPWLNSVGLGADLKAAMDFQDFIRWDHNSSGYMFWGGDSDHYGDESSEFSDDLLVERPGWRVQYAALIAEVVAMALETSTSYDQDTPAAPPGEDYVAWFLNEQKTGYCMHYATAATLLLRMLGVPARYVSGYVANIPATGRAAVPDRQAHAWVEIYLDGLGWYPIEFTPGFRGEGMGPDPEEETSERVEPTYVAESTPTPSPEPTPTEEPLPTSTTAPSTVPSQRPGQPGAPGGVNGLWTAFLLTGSGFALAVLAWYWIRKKQEERLHGPDTNAAVLCAMKRFRRLERWGCPEDPELTALAEKAKFSRHTLTEDERAEALERLTRHRAETLSALPWWKRWAARLTL